MVFFCQRNCYDIKFKAKVLSCKPVKTDLEANGKTTKITCYEVVFDDTVFFPEGGGQPYDIGYVEDIKVYKVIRRKGDAVHYLEKSVEVGSFVTQVIDWKRRHDHMQQHSAQHLITAIADRDLGCPTLSWNLGEKISTIELDAHKLSEDQVWQLEEVVNEAIRKCVPVSIDEFDATDPKLSEVRTRGLPEDVVGPLRVVTIQGIDANMCCGTHVSNLADLQAVKILYADKGKAGKILLFFVAGSRTLSYLGECVSREREITAILHSNSVDHVRLVEKAKKELKQTLKSLSDAFKDLARLEAFKLQQIEPKPRLFFHHRRDADAAYFGALIAEINDDSVLKVLTAGEDYGPGILMIHGNQNQIDLISKRVCEILDGKGGGKTRFTAKIQKPGKRKEAENFIRKTLHCGENMDGDKTNRAVESGR